MREQSETVVYDYKYDNVDNTEVLTLDDEPRDAKFWTFRPHAWSKACMQHYSHLHAIKTIKNPPHQCQSKYDKMK